MMSLRVALIHDEFVRRGGAEIVFEELLTLFPQADVFGLYASNRPFISLNDKRYLIHTSFLQRLPLWFRKHPSRLLPLLPQAAEQFDFSSYDLVISSSSGFAKGIVTRSSIPHICYCHTPTRYLWDTTHEAGKKAPGLTHWPLQLMLHYLRMADFAAAQRPDLFIANSAYTQDRIRQYYRREAEVVYPPIDTQFFTPAPTTTQDVAPFVILSRLTPAKHIEQAIQVCEKLQLPLEVIGVGAEMARLRGMARQQTVFLGKLSQAEVRYHVRHARALLQPGIEDFGMAAAEALACGTPVVACGIGGVKEIVTSGTHGWLYSTPRAESLAEALRQFFLIEKRFQPSVLQAQAMKFSRYRFQEGIQRTVDKVLRQQAKHPYHR